MSAAKKAGAKKATVAGPSYESMIKEAIIAHPEEARAGLGRPTIKKFINSKHPATAKLAPAQFNSLVAKAITRGAEKKTFVLPKGVSGKVKLAPKVKASEEAAAPAPVKKAAPKAAAAKAKAPVKKSTAKKTVAAKKAPAKKASSTTKAVKKAPAKAAATKKAAPKKAAAAKKLTKRTPLSALS